MGSEDISIVIPTIAGREDWLRKCTRMYEALTPGAEIIVIKDAPSCGVAWRLGAEQATREYLHLTADDILPKTGWWQAAMSFIDIGLFPAAMVISPTGSPALCNSPLGDMGMWPNVLVPFMDQKMLAHGGWWQSFHYGTDDWVTYRAVQLGYDVRRCVDYLLVHHVAEAGRNYMRRGDDVEELAKAMRSAGYLPPVYEKLVSSVRASEDGLGGVTIADLAHVDRSQIRVQEGHDIHS